MNRSVHLLAVVAAFAAATGSAGPALADPSKIGAWTQIFEGEIPAINMALMPDGESVVYYSGMEFSEHEQRDPVFLEWQFWGAHPHDGSTRRLDLARMGQPGAVTTPVNPTASGDLFCSSHVLRPDGTLVAVGGTKYAPANTPESQSPWDVLYGLRTTHYFDRGWIRGADMNAPRWYPSAVNLADGTTLVASGIAVLGNGMTQQDLVERMRHDGTFEAIGRLDHKPLYPRVFVVATPGAWQGKLFYTGAGQLWGPAGDFTDPEFAEQTVYDPATNAETRLGKTLLPSRDVPFCALAPLAPPDYRTRVLCGGGAPYAGPVAINLTEYAELTANGFARRLGPPMHHARWFPLPVHLADGSLLVAGGMQDHPNFQLGQTGRSKRPVLAAEIYDWATETWTEVAAMKVPREYHSTAILLPDGRVLVGGTTTHANVSQTLRENVEELDQVIDSRFELYEPPYLHRGARPEIANTGPLAFSRYGGRETLRVTSPSPIESVHLVRPGTVTHSVDNDARVVRLEWQVQSQAGDRYVLTVSAPPAAAMAPPGTYMLFVTRTTSAGPVPSVARMVKVGNVAKTLRAPPGGGAGALSIAFLLPLAAACRRRRFYRFLRAS